MASKTIKGLTVEIGGDTTKLGKALEDVNKKSRNLSGELGEINKLLKLDPKNTELLAQKQKILADAINNTKDKLDKLKQAEKQVQEQFKRGEVSEAQVRALQREIIATEKKLDGYKKAAKETAGGLDDMAESADKAGEASEGLGSKLADVAKGGLAALAAGVTAAIGALVASAEASRDYRAEMGKLDTAFTTAGHSSQAATGAYKELQSVIGETDQSVEAAQQIALLAEAEEDVAKWSGLAAGVVGRFGDALQPETFFEAANETLKLNEATGAYVQLLEGTGYSVDEFNAGLQACNTEAEKQAYMLEITDQLLGAAADSYRETNADIIRANQANEEWATTMAEVGGTVEPILTDVKLLGASLLADLVPGIQSVAEGFRGMLSGDSAGAAQMGEALSGIFEQLLSTLTNMLPMAAEMAISLVESLVDAIVDASPQLIETGYELFTSLMDGISKALPKAVGLVSSLVEMLTTQLQVLMPAILNAIMSTMTLLTSQLPVIIPQLLNLITTLVTFLVGQLPVLIPQVMSLLVSLIQLLAQQLSLLIPPMVTALISVVNLLVEQLPVITPMLIEAAITVIMALVSALPEILAALTAALPEVLQAVWDTIVMVFTNLPEWFGQLFQGAVDIIFAVFSVLGDFFAGIWETISEIFAPVGDFFSNAFSNAWNGIKGAFSGATNFFSGVWNGIKGAFSGVTNFFKDAFSSAWTAVKNVFSGVKDFFLGIWDKIKSAFSAIGTKIGDAISGAVKAGINGLLSSAEAIINGFLKMINGAIGIINKIPGVSIKKVKMVEFTKLAEGGVVDEPTPAIFGEDGAEAVVPLEKNTKWIQRVAQEFMAQVKSDAGAGAMSRADNNSSAADTGLADKLDKILNAIKAGQVIMLDGDTLVGATAGATDNALGQRRALVARGAI